ncbi:MAG: hypothetical protein R3A48_06700 [Polyangiales bacterium]
MRVRSAVMLPPVLLQPRANQPALPDPMPTDPLGDDAGLAPVADPATAAPTDTVVVTDSAPAAGELTQERCETANHDALISAGGYAFGASLVGVIIFLVMRKKLWSSAFGRYLTAISVASVIGASLAGWDPVASDELVRCVNSADLKQYVFLGGQLFARSIVLGLLPSFVATTLGCLVANRT